jgi:hypothetical protein
MSYAVLFWSVVTAEGLETTASPSTVKPRAQKHVRLQGSTKLFLFCPDLRKIHVHYHGLGPCGSEFFNVGRDKCIYANAHIIEDHIEEGMPNLNIYPQTPCTVNFKPVCGVCVQD